MNYLGLVESLKTKKPARPEPTVTLFDSLFLRKGKDKDLKFELNLYSSLEIVLLKFGIDIFHSLKTMGFSATSNKKWK